MGEYSCEKEIGLVISRQLVQMRVGKLNVKSTLGKGTTFSLDLDLPEVSHHANITNIEENNIVGFKGARRKVLVVDDKWPNRSVLVNLLEPIGFEVVEATDGLDALSKASEFKPDLRILPDLADVVIIAISASVVEFLKQYKR